MCVCVSEKRARERERECVSMLFEIRHSQRGMKQIEEQIKQIHVPIEREKKEEKKKEEEDDDVCK